MNVIVANKYSQMLSNLKIDIIKNVQGEYSADEIVSNFQNFFGFANRGIKAVTNLNSRP